MSLKLLFLLLFVGISMILAACSSPDLPTPTQIPIPKTATPVPTKAPVTEVPGPDVNKPKDFFELSDLQAAYASQDSGDETFTPFEINGVDIEQSKFPTIQSALFDREGNVLVTFGADAKVLLLGKFVVGSSSVSSALFSVFGSLTVLLEEDRGRIFSSEYKFLPQQGKVDFLMEALVIEKGARSDPPDLDYEKLAQDIREDVFPSSENVSLETQRAVLEIEYVENVLPKGVVINFGFRPDGSLDQERLKGSVAKDSRLGLEIFERKPNPDHPFPQDTTLQIQSLEKLSERDRLIFSGYNRAENKQTFKYGSISAIHRETSAIGVNTVVVSGDIGSHVFSLKCGIPVFVGVLLGSRQSESKETQASVMGIERILEFLEDSTGLSVPVSTNDEFCYGADSELMDRLISAISDGRYDFSFDLCFLNNNCLPKDISIWSPIFQTISVSVEDSTDIGFVEARRGIILGKYVAVISPLVAVEAIADKLDAEYKYRILIGETVNKDGEDKSDYEDLKFVGWDSSKRIALFELPQNFVNIHEFSQLPFRVGKSDELKTGNALYTTGAVNFIPFVGDPFPILRFASDPAHVIGFASKLNDRFYFQGSGRGQDIGGPLCALRDGRCEIVGFTYANLDKPQDETLSTALTVEFVLDAINEIGCANQILSLCRERAEDSTVSSLVNTSQVSQDREDIIALLAGMEFTPPLLLDILTPDLEALAEREAQVAIFTVDETGEGSDIVYRDSLILSDDYVLTASLLPGIGILSETGLILDTSDVTSNTILNGDDEALEVSVVLIHKFATKEEILQVVSGGTSTPEIEILEVVLVQRKKDYALLRRPSFERDFDFSADLPKITHMESGTQTGKSIFITFSKNIAVPNDTLNRIKLISPGTIIYSTENSPEFLLNGFISKATLGSAIYTDCGEEICLMGIVSRLSPNPDIIQTEGAGLSIDFIFKEIKEKTGIDLYKE